MRTIFLVALLAIGSPALAQTDEVPKFDIKAYCEKASAKRETMLSRFMKECETYQRSAYSELLLIWPAHSQELKARCIRVAEIDGQKSYSLLLGCIQKELG